MTGLHRLVSSLLIPLSWLLQATDPPARTAENGAMRMVATHSLPEGQDPGTDLPLPEQEQGTQNGTVFPQEPAPEGSLRDRIPAQVGKFVLNGVQSFPQLLNEGATDALICTYRSLDGVELVYQVIAWPSPERAESFLNEIASLIEQQGHQVELKAVLRDASGQKVGVSAQLFGSNEVILWTNQGVFMGLAGPTGEPSKFIQAYSAILAGSR
jgi:hypothetical protein